jgi:3-oxoacyl-[acyl-carrier-protein] synthase-3
MATTARIAGTGSYLPPKRVTNADLAKMVTSFDAVRAKASFEDWAFSVTGITERRHAGDESAEAMAAKASRIALEDAGVAPADVDAVIVGTFTPARAIPNAGITLCQLLDIPGAAALPVNAACAGFVYAMGLAYAMIRCGMARTALVASTEKMTSVLDYDDPKTTVLFGDGAGAAVFVAAEDGGICGPPYLSALPSEYIELGTSHATAAETRRCVEGTPVEPSHFVRMPGGPRVLKNAVDLMADALDKALERTPYGLDDLDYIVPHQANGRITKGLVKKLGVPPAKVCDIIDTLGNISGATVAIALDRVLRGGVDGYTAAPGHRIGLTALGGGYSIAGAVIEI